MLLQVIFDYNDQGSQQQRLFSGSDSKNSAILVVGNVPNILTLYSLFNMLRQGMNLYLKNLVSNFELCTAWLRVQVLHDCLCKVHQLYLNGVVGGRYQCTLIAQIVNLLWWQMNFVNVWFCRQLHFVEDKVKRLMFNSHVEQFFHT